MPATSVKSPAPPNRPLVRVGIGGWNYAPWRNNFYPAGLTQKLELSWASRQLRTIEINSTYYRAQTAATYARWAAATPDGFLFSLKAPRYITEGRRLADSGKGIDDFIHGGLDAMGDRLGPILWQLSPSRGFDADDLAAFLDQLPSQLNGQALRHVLEVRHPSFCCAAYVALVRSRGVPTVFTDSPKYPSLADISGPFVYARLMRSEDTQLTGYAPSVLNDWALTARQWAHGEDPSALPHVTPAQAAGPPREVLVYFIGSAKHRNPAAAIKLQSRIDAAD